MKPGEIVQVPLALSIDGFESRRDGIVKQPLSPTYFLAETDEEEGSEGVESQRAFNVVAAALPMQSRRPVGGHEKDCAAEQEKERPGILDRTVLLAQPGNGID